MPIRMTDDEPGQSDDDDSGGSGGGGGGGGGGRRGGGGGGGGSIMDLIGIAMLVFRYPKISAVVAVIAVGYFYFSSGDSGSPSPAPAQQQSGQQAQQATGPKHGTGATLDQKVYDETLVHEPLKPGELPSKVSLLQYAPTRRNQGAQGSCVGWATSYAARSILYARESGLDPDKAAFSPSFLYNQIALKGCNGTYLSRALDTLQKVGDVPFSEFAYTDKSCSNVPSSAQKQQAAEFRIQGFTRLSVDSDDYRSNALAIRQHLAQGAPVVIGMKVGGSFEHKMDGQKVWHPTKADYDFVGDWGGHAMSIIGYDDTVEGGAFQLMNSWGREWGNDGVAFVKYKDFDHFVKEAYGLYPMGNKAGKDGPQQIQFGLLETGTQRRIAVKPVDGITFRSVQPISKGTRFKVEFSNTKPTYTYLFGQETDGTSYVLFPYTPKHSPYCGTTGTRIFPRKQSLTADDKGTRDSVAVVISPRPLDFKSLNEKITAAKGATYAQKLLGALGQSQEQKAKVDKGDGLVHLEAAGADADKVHALVLEFDKT
jgi:hypothetical protein